MLRLILLGLVLRRLILGGWYCGRCSAAGLHVGAAYRKRIGLADQARQFGQRIALCLLAMLIVAATIVIMGGKRSVLISISHR